MKWQDTVIRSGEIKWRKEKVKSTDDGKLDFTIHIPMTELFRSQAKRSFGRGVFATLQFQMDSQTNGKVIEVADIVAFLNECGLPELAAEMPDAEMKTREA